MRMMAKQMAEMSGMEESEVVEVADSLVEMGLAVKHDDGSYEITEDGITALDFLEKGDPCFNHPDAETFKHLN
jgi:DNA-binding IclR family transcriptional regulator